LPERFLGHGPHGINVLARRGHKNHFPPAFVEDFVAWIRSHCEDGYAGEPGDWPRTS
jgi:hypothetical protein